MKWYQALRRADEV